MAEQHPLGDFATAVAAAKEARRRGEITTAARVYRLIPQIFPNKKHAVTVAADGLRDCGFWTEAVALLEDGLRRHPVSALYLMSLAEAYQAIDDHARASSYVERYLEYDSRDPSAWLRLAQLSDLAGNAARAEQAYANALARDPINIAAAVGRGDSLFQLDRPEEAIASYRRAAVLEPGNAMILFKLGSALLTQEAEAEGHDYLRQSLNIDPHNARAHVNLGLSYFNAGHMKEAVAAARNALVVDDQLQIAQVLLGIALAEQGCLSDAAAALTTATASGAHNAEALFTLAALQTHLENKSKAELALQRILSVEPGSREARHVLAAVHGEALLTPDDDYSREAFDRIAPQFDNQQLRVRKYRAPVDVARLIEEHEPERRSIESVLDIGCGTGLAVAALRDEFAVKHAVGIDASPRMTDIARRKSIYDEIVVDDIVRAVDARHDMFEMITAVDVFPYIGDLTRILSSVRARLAPGGLLVYSIEVSARGPMTLSATGRFVHTPAYVEEIAGKAGLRPVTSRAVTLRRSLGQDVPGVIGLLQA